MRRIKRVWHTLGRYRHGRGFGVHSPFAFSFILRTLRERTPYYAYPVLAEQRRAIKRLTRARHLMSGKHMRMLFRTVNFFSPARVLELGSLQGEEAGSVLETSARTTLHLCAPTAEFAPFLHEAYGGRISVSADLPADITDSMVLVGNIDDSLLLQAEDLLRRRLQSLDGRDTVIVFPHIRSKAIRRLWSEVRANMPYGMTFYNEKSFAVAVVRHKLPRQDFRVSL